MLLLLAIKKKVKYLFKARQSWGDITHETRENYYFIRADGRAISVFFERKNVTDFRFWCVSMAEWEISSVDKFAHDCGGLAHGCGHRRLNNVKRENVGDDGNDDNANRCLRQKKNMCALGCWDDAGRLIWLECCGVRILFSSYTVCFN